MQTEEKTDVEKEEEAIAVEEEGKKEGEEAETVEISESIEEETRPTEGEVTFKTEDSIVINGNIFGSGGKWGILSHMFPTEQTSWFDFAEYLTENGYIVLTYDFRGYGKTGGSKDISQIYKDLEAAVDFIKQYDIKKIFLVGASMGGTASIIVASKEKVDGLVSISAPTEFKGLSAVDEIEKVQCPKLVIASKGDVPVAESANILFEEFSEPKSIKIFDGSAHGTFIFDKEPEKGEILKKLILDFLNSY